MTDLDSKGAASLAALSRLSKRLILYSHSYERGFKVGVMSRLRQKCTHENIYENTDRRLDLDTYYIYCCTVV